MSTPHNQANKGEIAPIVLMPGDPLRAKYIAETYLEDVVCFNTVRNMFGYTGTYKGKKVSVMGSGMGMPSIGIYSFELFSQYDVETIIRLGSAGGYTKELHVYDVVLGHSAYSESTYAQATSGDMNDIQYPDEELNNRIIETAKKLDIDLKQTCIHSSDAFYHLISDAPDLAKKKGCAAVEMESFALFHNAKILNKKATTILTISDSFVYDEDTTPEQRQTSFNTMMTLALESIL